MSKWKAAALASPWASVAIVAAISTPTTTCVVAIFAMLATALIAEAGDVP